MRWLLTIFTIALLVRGVALWELSYVDPYFATPVVDELTNTQDALRIAAGERMDRPFWKPPLYPFALALTLLADPPTASAIYDSLPSPWIPKGLQALLDSLTAVLLVILGTRLVGARVGRLAGLIYAVSFTPVFYVAQILDTTMFTFLCVAALLTLDKARDKNDVVGWTLGGIVLGLAATARAPVLLFAPVAALLPWLHQRRLARAVTADVPGGDVPTDAGTPSDNGPTQGSSSAIALVSRMAAVGVGVVAMILPVTLANLKFGGDRVLISSNGGINFYIGNRKGDEPGADGLTSVNAGPRWRAILGEVDQNLKPSQRSREYYRLANEQIAADPGHFIARLARKSVALFDAFEVPNNKNFVEERSRSWIYTLLPGRTGVIFALGVMGLIFAWTRLRSRGLLVGFVVTQSVAIVMFFVAARYRVPLLAILTIPAAALLEGWWRERQQFPRLRASLIAVAIMLILTHVDVLGLRERFDRYVVDPLALAHARDNLARRELFAANAAAESNPERAQQLAARARKHFEASGQLYTRALEIDPDYPEVHHNLALNALEVGNLDEAESRCRLALKNSGDWFEEGWNTLGRILAARWTQESVNEAIQAFRRAIEIDARYSKAYANLGQVYERLNQITDARVNYEFARLYAPKDPLYFILEARIMGKMGRSRRGNALLDEIVTGKWALSPAQQVLFNDVRAGLVDALRRQQEESAGPGSPDAGPDETPSGGG